VAGGYTEQREEGVRAAQARQNKKWRRRALTSQCCRFLQNGEEVNRLLLVGRDALDKTLEKAR
jgi:hypothetical protein